MATRMRSPVTRPRALILRRHAALLIGGLLAAGCAFIASPQNIEHGAGTPHLTHGVAAGEVTATSVVVWGRCDRASTLTVTLQRATGGEATTRSVPVLPEHDFTGRILFDGLAPDTAYHYVAICGNDAAGERGIAHTAPAPTARAAVRFAWSGDLGGQNACRDAAQGYPIFDRIGDVTPDFFIALGDMIYADNPCAATGRYGNAQIPGAGAPATDLEAFWEAWKYNRADAAFRRFLARTPYYAVWDDHEIRDDAGPQDDTLPSAPQTHLLPIARAAFLDYQPLIPPSAQPTRMYRRVRWGRHLELFFLDTRQYRDANRAPDSARQPKTMLGAAQRRWLIDGLTHSTATWKVVVSSVPMAIPTGKPEARDGWANAGGHTGFEHALLDILRVAERAGVRNQLWLTTDVHFATGFRYMPFPRTPQFTVYELVSGPLSAGVFPTQAVDPSFAPQRLFFHGPPSADAIPDYEAAQSWFNFGVIDIAADGTLSVRIINGKGAVVAQQTLTPTHSPHVHTASRRKPR